MKEEVIVDRNGQPEGDSFPDWDRYFDDVLARSKTHPGIAESLLPVWGPAREAVADFQEGDLVGGLVNAAFAATDLTAAGGIRRGLKMGAKYAAERAPKNLKTVPFDYRNVRAWMKREGHILKDRPVEVHHGIVPQRWKWDERITNHPLNLKPMKPGMHNRIHGNHRTKPQYGVAKQVWYGLPTWTKMSVPASRDMA